VLPAWPTTDPVGDVQRSTDEIVDRREGRCHGGRYELLDMVCFPGMEPFGTLSGPIIVKGRRVALIGARQRHGQAIVLMGSPARRRHERRGGPGDGAEEEGPARPSLGLPIRYRDRARL
jgi:hypothetical protein